jgi:hypothetical protein
MESDIPHFQSSAPCRRRSSGLHGNDSCPHINGIAPDIIWVGSVWGGLKQAKPNLDATVHESSERPRTDGVCPAFDLASTKSQGAGLDATEQGGNGWHMMHARMAATQSDCSLEKIARINNVNVNIKIISS